METMEGKVQASADAAVKFHHAQACGFLQLENHNKVHS